MKRAIIPLFMLLFLTVSVYTQEPLLEDAIEDKEQFTHDQDYSDEELFPDKMSFEDTPTVEPWVEKDTDNKGIYYEIHYDEFERAFKVEDYFIRGYRGVSEYEFFPKLQKRERDGMYGYEWVISKEIGTFYKGDEIIATRVITFDKQRDKVSEEKTGSTVMVFVIRLLSQFYNIDPPEDV